MTEQLTQEQEDKVSLAIHQIADTMGCTYQEAKLACLSAVSRLGSPQPPVCSHNRTRSSGFTHCAVMSCFNYKEVTG